MSAWIMLLVAGPLETGWAIGLKYSASFARPVPSILTAAAMIASIWLLGLAVRTLPIGAAYAVWVGIGALGTAVPGAVLFREPLHPARVQFLVLLLVAIAGLRLTAR